MKHTQGNWSVLPEECDKSYIRIRGTRLGGRYKIANVITPTYDGVDKREAEETRANARLIAAAPELLEALIDCRRALEIANFTQELAVVNAAISKATGASK